MTSQLTIRDIERLLRTAAPDEPSVLPALTLPSGATAVRATTRLRTRDGGRPATRPALVVALLLLAFAAALVAAGAVRLLQQDDVDLTSACDPMRGMMLDPSDATCRPVAVPDGWYELGAGQLMAGPRSEDGLAYEVVTLIMTTVPLDGCASPGGPMPTGVPVGSNAIEVPAPTPDAGLACLRAATLPDNGIRVVTMGGFRVAGVDGLGLGIPDTSEPTAAAGWTEVVDGRPARLTVTTAETGGRVVETRTWDILRPGLVDSVLRITADIAGPDLAAGRAAVQRVIDAVDFKWHPPALDESDPNEVLRVLLDGLDRQARSDRSDLYRCFPREPGSARGTISAIEGGPAGEPLDVTCSSSITRSVADVWRITLEVSWDASEGIAADTIRTEFFSTGERYGSENSSLTIDLSGGHSASLAGRPMSSAGLSGWYPVGDVELPPRLDAPLDLPPGSVVEVLWPGAVPLPGAFPGEGGDGGYPGLVGRHRFVVDGPTLVDGDEWYRVQSGSGFEIELEWLPGTGDGRPLLRPIEPSCPVGELTVGDASWLIAGERLLCFAGRDVTFERAVLTEEPGFSFECGTPDGGIEPCPTANGEGAWITGRPMWLWGAGGPSGPEPAFFVWLAPGVERPSSADPVRVVGHVGDPAAEACRALDVIGPFGFTDPDPAYRELLCRQRFVVTSIEPVG